MLLNLAQGDVLALSGVPYRVGRESRSEYNELNAGVVFQNPSSHTFLRGSTGVADQHVPGYTYRLCLTNNASLAVPLMVPPPHYSRSLYEGYLDDHQAGRLPSVWSAFSGPRPLPNGKFDMNTNPRPLGFAMAFGTSAKDAYPDGSWATRDVIVADIRDRTLGLLYFLQHDSAVPAQDRSEALKYNLTRDEFADNGLFPFQLYVREARRMRGDFVMSEADMVPDVAGGDARPPVHADSVAAAETPTDAFPASPRLPDSAGIAAGGASEGYIDEDHDIIDLYTLSRRIMLPPGLDNLLVSVAVSASHVAFSGIRMEPQWMTLGVASGVWAALARKAGTQSTRDVSVLALQQAIVARGESLISYSDLSGLEPSWPCFQLLGPYGLAETSTYEARPDASISRGLLADWLNATLTARLPNLTLPAVPAGLSFSMRWGDLEYGQQYFAAASSLALVNITSPALSGHNSFRPEDHATTSELHDWIARASSAFGIAMEGQRRRHTLPLAPATNATRAEACQALMMLAVG